MSAVVSARLQMVEAVAALRLPPVSDRRLRTLMDCNNDGALTTQERDELESLVELSETISLVRADALQLLAAGHDGCCLVSPAKFVQSRADNRCECCKMHQALQGATFHIEHTIPQSRGGPTAADNLAWCCPSCNLPPLPFPTVRVKDPRA